MFLIVSRRAEFVETWQAAWRRSSATGAIHVLTEGDSGAIAIDPGAARLVAVDIRIFPSDRANGVRRWKAAFPSTPLIVGGDEFSPERELAALGIGVSACCDQRLAEEGLARVVNVVLGGGVWVSAAAMPQLMDRLSHAVPGRMPDIAPSPLSLLTERQRAVAELLAQGESNKIIGRKLNIADRTVKAHLSAIFEKLMVSDRVQLAVLLNRRERESAGTKDEAPPDLSEPPVR